MPPPGPTDPDLRRRWRAWTELVGAFASRRGRRVDPAAYQATHRELVGACEARAAAAEGPARQYYLDLAELVRPWLSTRVLEQGDWGHLSDLHERCRRVGRELDPGSGSSLDRLRFLAGYPALVAAVVVLLVVVVASGLGGSVSEWVDGWLRILQGTLRRLSLAEKLIAGGVVLAAVGGWLVCNMRRT